MINILKNFQDKAKRLALLGGPLAVAGTFLATASAHAQAIPTASTTALITGVAQEGWDAFYANFPTIAGVLVAIGIVIGGAFLIIRKLTLK